MGVDDRDTKPARPGVEPPLDGSEVACDAPADPAGFARRSFLARSGAVLAAGVGLRGIPPGVAGAAELAVPNYKSWAAVQAAFPLSKSAIHFASFLLASHPTPVSAAIETYRRALDADAAGYLFRCEAVREQEVPQAAAGYLGASEDEIALTDSTTMGLGLLYVGLFLSPGEEILTSTHDFYSTHEALRLRALAGGGIVRKIPLYRQLSSVSIDEIVSSVQRAIRPKTRYLALTWVHSSTGLKLPIAEVGKAVAQANANRDEHERVIFCVDGVHGFGIEDVDAAKLGCDFLVSGCHKWLFGPRGTGLIWGRRAAWKRTNPTIPTFDGRNIIGWLHPGGAIPVPPGAAMTPGGFHSLEHRWALSAAFRFHNAIERKRVAERTHALAAQLKDGLATMRNVTLRTPRSSQLSSGLMCFDVKGLEAPDDWRRPVGGRRQPLMRLTRPELVRTGRFARGRTRSPACPCRSRTSPCPAPASGRRPRRRALSRVRRRR